MTGSPRIPRIAPVDYGDASAEAKLEYDRVVAQLGRMTNMKRTLLHSMPSFRALMAWYPLRDSVVEFLGERLTDLFTLAISSETDCLVCSTYFRRALVGAGENPDEFEVNEREEAVLQFGRALAAPRGRIEQELYEKVAESHTDEQMVALTAFGAMMVATNIFNNALEVELDDYLQQYRVGAPAATIPTENAQE